MPTRTFRRIWCKTCNEFRLHNINLGDDDYNCCECKTVYTDIKINDIPKDKANAQRERYKESKKKQYRTIFGSYLNLGLETMFSNDWGDRIIESDCGQKTIDDEYAKKRAEALEILRLERNQQREEAKKYQGLTRNDICICGSGKKYKQCCLTKIRSYV